MRTWQWRTHYLVKWSGILTLLIFIRQQNFSFDHSIVSKEHCVSSGVNHYVSRIKKNHTQAAPSIAHLARNVLKYTLINCFWMKFNGGKNPDDAFSYPLIWKHNKVEKVWWSAAVLLPFFWNGTFFQRVTRVSWSLLLQKKNILEKYCSGWPFEV